jgi:hypothetical protein
VNEQKPDLQKFELFLGFLKGDARVPDAFRWSLSIGTKKSAMRILYEEVSIQIPKCFDELKEIREKGFGSGIECLKLALKYEVFLNSVYALCENLSSVVHYLYPSKTLPQKFRKQKIRFLKDPSLDSGYSKILMGTSWYDEVSAIRSEATHYLSGFIVISSPTELGYFNVPKSEKKDVSINDVEEHIKRIYGDVLAFLSLFGKHFVTIINQDSPIALPCLRTRDGLLGVKSISLREYLNNEPGICQTIALDCPEKDSCEARKKGKK